MPIPEFVFSMKVAGRDQFDGVLDEVAANVFSQCGCSSAVAAGLVRDLNAALIPGSDDGTGFDVQFRRAHGGACEVVVFVREREIWRTSCPITA